MIFDFQSTPACVCVSMLMWNIMILKTLSIHVLKYIYLPFLLDRIKAFLNRNFLWKTTSHPNASLACFFFIPLFTININIFSFHFLYIFGIKRWKIMIRRALIFPHFHWHIKKKKLFICATKNKNTLYSENVRLIINLRIK